MSGNLEQFLAEARSPFLRKKAIIFSVPPQIVSPSSNRDLQVVILSKNPAKITCRVRSRVKPKINCVKITLQRNDIAEGLRYAWLCTLLISSSATGSRLRTVIILGEGLVSWAELGLLREGLRMREAVSRQDHLIRRVYTYII